MDEKQTDAMATAAMANEVEKVRIDVCLDGVQALTLCANLQLALRHPDNVVCTGAVREFIAHCIDVFDHSGCKETADILRLGNNPAFDGARSRRVV